MIMEIDHIGYAVKRIDRAIEAFQKMGFAFETTIDDADRNVKLVFGEKDGYRIELVSVLDKMHISPVDQYLSNSVGTPYHICYASENFDDDLEELKRQGFKEIIEPRPAIAFNGKRVVFLMNIGFGLMEIVEK
jgi:methylmalonyl-CoA/ethylmalonyl-CoA epimerase